MREMRDLLKELKSRIREVRIKAANEIISREYDISKDDLIDSIAGSMGFSPDKGKSPKDCQYLTKKWLRLEWDATLYRKIDKDPYQDMLVLPDIYLDEQEHHLLQGARAAGEEEFFDNGGEDTLEILKSMPGAEPDDVKNCWLLLRNKNHYTYSDYIYASIITLCAGGGRKRALAVLTNGKIIEIPVDEIETGGEFIDLT